jgi:hypothetical protein
MQFVGDASKGGAEILPDANLRVATASVLCDKDTRGECPAREEPRHGHHSFVRRPGTSHR